MAKGENPPALICASNVLHIVSFLDLPPTSFANPVTLPMSLLPAGSPFPVLGFFPLGPSQLGSPDTWVLSRLWEVHGVRGVAVGMGARVPGFWPKPTWQG